MMHMAISVASGLEQNTLRLQAAFKKNKLSVGLQQVLSDVFNGFVRQVSCPYGQLIYLHDLQESLLNRCMRHAEGIYPRQEQEEVFTAAVEEQLIYLNFNHPDFTNHYKRKIETAIAFQYNVQHQFEQLYRYEKQLLSQPELEGVGYDKRFPTVKRLLLIYIKAELRYLKNKTLGYSDTISGFAAAAAAGSAPPARLAASECHPFPPPYRVKALLSVDSLAYLVRLLVETAAIEAIPKTSLLQFICTHFETPRTAGNPIGYESLLSKYKQPVQRTADGIKVLLRKMIKQIEQDFG